MNTRGSDSAAAKTSKTDVAPKSTNAAQKATTVKVPERQVEPPKPMLSKEIGLPTNAQKKAVKMAPVIVKHVGPSTDELPKRSIFKSTFNTHDIMHAPVEKTIQMLDKILAGERLFTM